MTKQLFENNRHSHGHQVKLATSLDSSLSSASLSQNRKKSHDIRNSDETFSNTNFLDTMRKSKDHSQKTPEKLADYGQKD